MSMLQVRPIASIILVFCFFAVTGCATYQGKVGKARDDIKNGQPAEAIKILQPLAEEDGKDQLVFMLDYATALQLAGNYKESAKEFQASAKIADIQDYHSISKIATSMVLSEEMVQYKGDDYEKVLINAINAINYLEMGDLDETLVEVKRLNEMLYKFKYEAKRDYDQNPFAYYLSAVIWEAGQKYDDAYIAYKATYDLIPNYRPLHEDLIRAAIKAQRPEELDKWEKEFPEVKVKAEWNDRTLGEIVLVYMQGWGPRKQPRPNAPRFPHLVPVHSLDHHARLTVGNQSVQSSEIFDVQKVAIKTLDDDFARLMASRVAGAVTKAVIADQIAQKNQALGLIAGLAMAASDRADLRQWSTLPETFQIARMTVKPGTYQVQVSGVEGGEQMSPRTIEVKPGRKAFLSWRSVR